MGVFKIDLGRYTDRDTSRSSLVAFERELKRMQWDDSRYILKEQVIPPPQGAAESSWRMEFTQGLFTVPNLRESEPKEYSEAKNNRKTFDELISPYHNPPRKKKITNKEVSTWGHVSRQAYESARRDASTMSPIHLLVACLYFYIDVETAKEMFCICVGTDPLSSTHNTYKLGRALELFLKDSDYDDDRSTDEAYVEFVKTTATAYAYDDDVELPPFLSRNEFWKKNYNEACEDLERRGLK